MFDEKRRITSIVYLSCLFLTIVIIFIPFGPYNTVKLVILVVLLLIQFCASVWYTLSYIPYGRRAFIRMVKGCIGMDSDTSSQTTA